MTKKSAFLKICEFMYEQKIKYVSTKWKTNINIFYHFILNNLTYIELC